MPIVLTPLMFLYLSWKNKNGESLQALFEESKAKMIAQEMKDMGFDVKLSPENFIPGVK